MHYLRATGPEELSRLGSGLYDGLEYGAEFCSRRLPSPAEVQDAAALCRRLRLGFAVVTPPVREGAFDAVSSWLREVSRAAPGTEWTSNDWGLLTWAREQELALRFGAGRVLGRQRRDPRVLQMLLEASPAETGALRGSLWDDPKSGAVLAELGVERVELDLLLQGVRRPVLPEGVSLSLCGPWLPVTFSPSCPWSSDPSRCACSCQTRETAVLRTPETPQPLWSRGNALFARRETMPDPKEIARLGADRLVWSPEIPG